MGELLQPPPPARRPLTQAAARNFALINQLATPGLGSLLAGRWLAGTGQLLLAIAGFGLLIAWFAAVICNQIQGGSPFQSTAWMGEAGTIGFVGSWLWALFTSLNLLRQAREQARGENQLS